MLEQSLIKIKDLKQSVVERDSTIEHLEDLQTVLQHRLTELSEKFYDKEFECEKLAD